MSRYSLRALPVVGMVLLAACRDAPSCAPPPVGVLRVTTVTVGTNIDPDGYTLEVRPQVAGRDSVTQAIGVNETFNWELGPGTFAVALQDVQSNCLVQDENPRSITLVTGATVSTTFTVSCS